MKLAIDLLSFCVQLPAGAPLLADVCHDPLLEVLGPNHLKPLLAASRQLRAAVHSFVPSLTIGDGDDAATSSSYDILLLTKGNWANLTTLILKQPLQLGDVLDLTRGHLPLLSSLEAHIQGRSTLPFSQLATGNWPLLKTLNLSNSHLTAAAMAEVKRGRWPALKQLVLHSCRLTSRAIAHLTEAQWTSLELIDLHDNPMDAQDMANLAAGFWPSLTTLNVGTLLEQAAWGNLIRGCWPKLQRLACSAEWPLSSEGYCQPTQIVCPTCGAPDTYRSCLCLLGFPCLRHFCLYQPRLCVDMAAWTTLAWHAQLHKLHLTGCSISAAAFAPYGCRHWLRLQELDMGCVDVDAEVISYLTDAKMPMLRTLRLDRSKGMTVAAFAELVVGDWPLLKHLCLSDTFMDENEAVTMPLNYIRHLVQGQWPSLERLELSNCLISVDALRVLVTGQWPSLCYLDLSCNLLDEESFATLRGKSGQQIKQCVNILKPTQLLAGGFWPKLSYIDLSPGAHE